MVPRVDLSQFLEACWPGINYTCGIKGKRILREEREGTLLNVLDGIVERKNKSVEQGQESIIIDPVFHFDLIITITIYIPRKNWGEQRMVSLSCLGSTTLATLRDYIDCPSDRISTGTHATPSNKLPGFFAIENVFYVDDRCEDISDDIINSLKSEFTIAKTVMSAIRLIELKPRLNHNYLYHHQADCGHILTFDDVRLFSCQDSIYRYPKVLYRNTSLPQSCNICELYEPSYVTTQDTLADCDPCLWCTSCYNEFHLEEDGTRVYNSFTVYPYKSTI